MYLHTLFICLIIERSSNVAVHYVRKRLGAYIVLITIIFSCRVAFLHIYLCTPLPTFTHKFILCTRVARFFQTQYTRTGGGICQITTTLPNGHKIYQMAVKYSKRPLNIPTFSNSKVLQNLPKFGCLVC
jgi:hypothetical protein